MRENLSLNKEDELVPDILNLMCLQNIQLKVSQCQAFTYPNTIQERITIIQTRDDYGSDQVRSNKDGKKKRHVSSVS